MSFRIPAGALLACLALSPCAAPALTLDEARQAAAVAGLSESAYWRVLLRYDHGKPGHATSAITKPGFFLHADGARLPAAELNADLDALFAPAAADQGFACRFPARAAWLTAQLKLTSADLPPNACPALDAWMHGINPAGATLIFAADYMNNPSSMFGHTLLRIDSPDQNEETRLLAYAINYSAQTDQANSLSFAWKGVTGGYPGAFSIMPYYQKVKEYNDFENRDLWEYRLNLSEGEIRQLLNHLWELKGVMLPYYFFSSNCSYQLLGMFEAARSGLALRRDFPVYAAPVDTLRRVLAEPGMLKEIVYRPASGTLLDAHARRNPHAVNRAAITLARDPKADLGALDHAGQARALEMAYDYLYYRYLEHKAPADTTPPMLRQLLIRRSTYAEPDNRVAPPRPVLDPGSGHLTSEWQAGVGRDQRRNYAALDFRPAYHDLLDPEGGFRQGASIDFLRTQLRLWEDDRKAEVRQFTLVHIDSLSPRNDFLKPMSWNLGLGARQVAVDRQGAFSPTDSHIAGYFEGGMGVALRPADGVLCDGQLQGAVEGGKRLADGWRAMAGPRFGCRWQGERSQWLGRVESLWSSDSERFRQDALIGWQWNLTARDGLRVEGTVEQEGSRRRESLEAGWRRYF